MGQRITEARVVDALATQSEEAIREWFRPPRCVTIDDAALPHLASIATAHSDMDRVLQGDLKRRTCPQHLWRRIADMARDGTRVKAYAQSMTSS